MDKVHNLLRNLFAGISAFLIFFTISLFLLFLGGYLSFIYLFLSFIAFLLFFFSALYEKTRIRRSRRQEIQELSRLLQKGEKKAIKKGKNLIRGFIVRKEYLNMVKLFNILSYTQIWEESIKLLQEEMQELPDKEIHKLINVFLDRFKTENKNKKAFLLRQFSEISENLVRDPNIRNNIKKRVKSTLNETKG